MVDIGGDQAIESIDLSPAIKENPELKFLVLNLNDLEGTKISHNVYWLEEGNDFVNLSVMPRTRVSAKMIDLSELGGEKELTIEFSNSTNQLAFFIRPQLIIDEDELLPTYWSASYFSLAPGESLITKVRFEAPDLGKRMPMLKVSGWNVDSFIMAIN
jgi:hypothetical protein